MAIAYRLPFCKVTISKNRHYLKWRLAPIAALSIQLSLPESYILPLHGTIGYCVMKIDRDFVLLRITFGFKHKYLQIFGLNFEQIQVFFTHLKL